MLFESRQQAATPTVSTHRNPGALGLYIESIRGGKGAAVFEHACRLFIHMTVFKEAMQEV